MTIAKLICQCQISLFHTISKIESHLLLSKEWHIIVQLQNGMRLKTQLHSHCRLHKTICTAAHSTQTQHSAH